VTRKFQVPAPDRFEGVARCSNPNCITAHERWTTRFAVTARDPLTVRCCYCERSFLAADLTLL
jgi:aspartate carbamoyltransferase regulatory subunit